MRFVTLRKSACRIAWFAPLALLLSAVSVLRADTVEVKGGDRLTGTAVKLDGGKLIFKTAYAADPIAIAWDQVVRLTVDKPMILTTAKGKLTVTALAAEGKTIEATTAAGTSTVAAAEIKALRTPADQSALENAKHPNWGHAWAITANASLAVAEGNAQTESVGVGATAVRATSMDKTTANFNSLYSRDNKEALTTANSTGGGLRYDRNMNAALFVYGAGDFLSNGQQNLDLRSILSGGFGWHAVKGKEQTLDVFGGGSWTHEHYSASASSAAVTNSFAALNLGETYARKLGKPSSFNEQCIFYPNMNQLGSYQLQMTSGLSTRLTKLLNWNVNFSDNYTSFPPEGTKANDMVFTTGIGVTLARP